MRTKTLLLTAAFTAAGIATSMAQAVYSVNMVGYINKTLVPGLQMVANQLNASPNNQVQNVFGSPAGVILSVNKFDPGTGSFINASYDDLDGWINGTLTLNPGEGAFIDNASGGDVDVTFVGEVQLVSSVSLISGLQIYSSVLPQSGPIDAMDFPPAGSTVLSINQFDTGTGTYVNSSWDDLDGWVPGVPSLEIAESFFLDNAGAAVSWDRSFSVGP